MAPKRNWRIKAQWRRKVWESGGRVLRGHNLPPLVDIRLNDLAKIWGCRLPCPPASGIPEGCMWWHIVCTFGGRVAVSKCCLLHSGKSGSDKCRNAQYVWRNTMQKGSFLLLISRNTQVICHHIPSTLVCSRPLCSYSGIFSPKKTWFF